MRVILSVPTFRGEQAVVLGTDFSTELRLREGAKTIGIPSDAEKRNRVETIRIAKIIYSI